MTFNQFWRSEKRNLTKIGITSPIAISSLKIGFQIAWLRGGEQVALEMGETRRESKKI